MIRVAVLGAEGRMGREVCAAVEAEPDLELTEEVDVGLSSLDALVENNVQVAVDFTNAEAASENIPWCIKNGIHVVVGTSGILPEVVQEIAELCPKCEGNVLIAPNFAIGAVLAMKFSEIAAAWMPDAEVIELHHSGKMDSPSGTALQTVESILRGRRQAPAERPGTLKENLPGARGAERDGVHVHSVRLPGLVAHQEVLFGGPGQTLTIRHDSLDRKSFMPGVILGIREIANHPGLTVGLEHYLGL
jgi:4-hydroxy-tetrahydrodipicolinate reductase